MRMGLIQSSESQNRTKKNLSPEQEGILLQMTYGLDLQHWLLSVSILTTFGFKLQPWLSLQ